MRERINKPRVFLSHARKDVKFIERIESDLRKCQIEPWRDQNEIRDGEPWQNVIFGEGLPTCDVIITYYTENSLASQMVSKEVDATLLRQLSDNGIGFLPYVNSNENRNKLRLDIQALHCRVWNDENYNEIFPSVVAEIWRRYMERSVANAVLVEKNRRLELELELKEIKNSLESSTFNTQEMREFDYIYSQLKKPVHLTFPVNQKIEIEKEEKKYPYHKKIGEEIYETSVLEILMPYVNNGYNSFLERRLSSFLNTAFRKNNSDFPKREKDDETLSHPTFNVNITLTLKTFGLVESKDNLSQSESFRGYDLYFTPKMYRFKFWLEYNGLIESPSFKFVDYTEKTDENK